MKYFILFMAILIHGCGALGAYKRYFQDPKWPNDKSVYVQSFTNPAAASTASILDDFAGNTTTTAVTKSSGFIAQPDVPRNLVITPGSTTADVAACTVVVNGTDIKNATISENFAFAENTSAATTGSKAFKTVTSVVFPANCEDSPYTATWDVGYGEKLGLNRCLDNAGDVFFSQLNGAKEATAPTIAANASVVSSNTSDFNGTMNGSNDFNLIYWHNYGSTCLP